LTKEALPLSFQIEAF